MSKSIDDFLSLQSQDGVESSGEFQLAPQELVKKLGGALIQPQAWVLKFVQAAVNLRSTLLTVKITRRWLELEMVLPESFALDPHDFFNLARKTRAHEHLLFGTLCAVNLHTTVEATLSWSFEGRSGCVLARNQGFQFLTVEDGTLVPVLKFALQRRPVTTLERLFRKACFGPEYRLLHERSRLCPLDFHLDGRRLGGAAGPWGGELVSQAAYCGGDGSASLDVSQERRVLTPVWAGRPLSPGAPRESHWNACLEFFFYRRLGRNKTATGGACHVAWVLDGVIIQMEEILGTRNSLAFVLYLPADGLGTDLSSLNLIESVERRKRSRDPGLREWQKLTLRTLEADALEAESADQSDQANRTLRELKALAPFSKENPINWRALQHAANERAEELRQHFNTTL